MNDRQQQPRSPLKTAAPHLQSPSFSPPVTTTSKKKPSMLKQPPESTTHNEVDNIVKLAYKQIKREREVIRKKLVTNVIKHSRDDVIHKQRKSDQTDDVATSSATTNGKKRKHCNGSSSIRDDMKSPSSSPGGRKKKKRSSSSDMSITNGKNDKQLYNNQSFTTQYKKKQPTLVFPRLPSNDCPQSIHQQIVFCPPCDNDQSTTTTKEDTKSQQPPFNLSTKQCKVSIKSKNKLKPSDFQYDTTKSGTTSTTTSYNPLNITGSHSPLPKSSSLILLNSSFAVDDTPSLQHVPYFEDGDNEDIYSDLFDTKERERLYEFGPKYCEKETFESVDSVLILLAKENEEDSNEEGEGNRRLLMDLELYNVVVAKSNKEAVIVVNDDDEADDDSDTTTEKKENDTMATDGKKKTAAPKKKKKIKQSDIEKLERIHLVLSELANIDLNRVHERHAVCFFKKPDKPVFGQRYSDKSSCYQEEDKDESAKLDDNEKKNEASATACSSSDTNSDSKEAAVPPYESVMDSYRDLLCRRCFTYDCNIHGNLPKANLKLLGELAVKKELDGHWKESDKDIDLDKIMKNNGKTDGDTKTAELTPAQQSICEHAFTVYQGDTTKVAHILGTTPSKVNSYVQSQNIELQPNQFVTKELLDKQKAKRGSRLYTSMSNYNPKWLRQIQSKVIHPAFLPCDHCEPCNEETCSCIQNGFFCTKHCGWAQKSPNFFRGCECKNGQCNTPSCSCFAAKRECDPDLCKTCGACCDPPESPATTQRCRNDNISMRRQAHTLIAQSKIKAAGWGLFTKHSLKRGDFVIEYVGEQISQEEAERRGVIYDKMNMSYLFNLSSDLVIDATRKGNHSRYANHSNTPNMEPRMIHVNGGMRIGFFAKCDVDAQSELFFDYRYDDKMDNELIYKPDHSVNFSWMQKSEKKKKSGSKK